MYALATLSQTECCASLSRFYFNNESPVFIRGEIFKCSAFLYFPSNVREGGENWEVSFSLCMFCAKVRVFQTLDRGGSKLDRDEHNVMIFNDRFAKILILLKL